MPAGPGTRTRHACTHQRLHAGRAFAVAAGMALSCGAQAQPQAGALSDFSALYQGSKRFGPLTARAEARIRLQHTARHLAYTMDTTVRLAFIERRFHDCSLIELNGATLRPLAYVHRDHSDPTHDVRTTFDWPRGQALTVIGPAGAPAAALPIAAPTWDPMSFQVALMARAAAGAAGSSETHRVVERGVLKLHHVHFNGVVPMPEAQVPGLVHEVVSRKEGSDKGAIVLRLAQEPAWQPVRITLDDVTIQRVSGAPPANQADAAASPCLPEGGAP